MKIKNRPLSYEEVCALPAAEHRRPKKPSLFFLAILLHTAVDAMAVILKDQIPIAVLELIVMAFAVMTVFIAFAVWKRYLKSVQGDIPETEETPA